MTTQPRTISFVGFAPEVTPGTPVAPTTFAPIRNLTPADLLHYVPDQGLRGSMVDTYNEISTQAWSTYGIEGDVFVDVMGYPLKSLLGDETVTGSAAPYSHAISTLNTAPGQPTTYTITDYNGVETRQFPYSRFNSLAFKLQADQLFTYTGSAMGFKSSTTTKPTQSFSTLAPKPSWQGATSIAGSSTNLLGDATITIARKVDPILAINGTQNPYKIWAGAVTASGSMTLIYEDATFMTDYLNGTTQALDITMTSGTGATTQGFVFHATKALFTKADVNRSKEWVELTVDFECVANTTDAGTSGGYSPCLITLTNAVSAAY